MIGTATTWALIVYTGFGGDVSVNILGDFKSAAQCEAAIIGLPPAVRMSACMSKSRSSDYRRIKWVPNPEVGL